MTSDAKRAGVLALPEYLATYQILGNGRNISEFWGDFWGVFLSFEPRAVLNIA